MEGHAYAKGKFWYMQLWWCFNQMTRVCPALRLAISKRLGMKVIDNRKKHQKSKILKNIKLKEKTVRERNYGRRHEYMCRNIKL